MPILEATMLILEHLSELFQLLHQVGGRAGRGDSKGVVYLQSYYPDNTIFSYVKAGDEDSFFANELEIRKSADMPFSKNSIGNFIRFQ